MTTKTKATIKATEAQRAILKPLREGLFSVNPKTLRYDHAMAQDGAILGEVQFNGDITCHRLNSKQAQIVYRAIKRAMALGV